MDLKTEIEKLGKGLTAYVGEEIIEVSHKDFLFDYDFDRLEDDVDTLEKIKDFLSYEYIFGRSIRKKDYFETVIAAKNYYLFGGFDEDLEIEAKNIRIQIYFIQSGVFLKTLTSFLEIQLLGTIFHQNII